MAKPDFNLFTAIETGSGSTYWHKVGAAWMGSKGFTLEFSSLPLPNAQGKVLVNMFPDEPKPQNEYKPPKTIKPSDDLDDDVPF